MTFGYSKESENISLNRILNGYIDKEGNLVYKDVGLDKKTLLNTLRSLSKNTKEEKILNNLLDLNIDKKIAKSLLNKYGYKNINTYIKYLNYKLDKGFKAKDSIAAFLVDSIVNSYILPENFKQSEDLERKRKESAKKFYKSIKGYCIASKTMYLYPYCPYCEKFKKY